MTDSRPRFDILILPRDRRLRITDHAARAVLNYIGATKLIEGGDESPADTWVELYLKPGSSAHEIFTKGGSKDEPPIFLEMLFRFGTEAVEFEYDGVTLSANLALEIRGSLYPTPLGRFIRRLEELLHMKPQVFHRPHAGLPPHREVPEGRERKVKERLKKKVGGGLAGTVTEEW